MTELQNKAKLIKLKGSIDKNHQRYQRFEHINELNLQTFIEHCNYYRICILFKLNSFMILVETNAV